MPDSLSAQERLEIKILSKELERLAGQVKHQNAVLFKLSKELTKVDNLTEVLERYDGMTNYIQRVDIEQRDMRTKLTVSKFWVSAFFTLIMVLQGVIWASIDRFIERSNKDHDKVTKLEAIIDQRRRKNGE